VTTTAVRPVEPGAAPPPPEEPRGIPRWAWALAVLAGWIVVWSFTKGEDTLVVAGLETTDLHDSLSDWGGTLGDSAFTRAIGDALKTIVQALRELIAIPTSPSPAPTIGWLGVVAVATWIGYAVANWRIALLVLGTFLSFGLFGYWSSSMDLLVVTIVSVGLTVIIGFPLAVWMGISRRAARVITLLIDLLQTMPTSST
jgi:glycine betaine/proline transport system permease protein